jgi:hypothetical protein
MPVLEAESVVFNPDVGQKYERMQNQHVICVQRVVPYPVYHEDITVPERNASTTIINAVAFVCFAGWAIQAKFCKLVFVVQVQVA